MVIQKLFKLENISRKALVAASVSLLLMCTLSIPVSSAMTQQTSTPIKHLIVITMENHSFDNIFGKYPLNNASENQTLVSSITRPLNLLSGNVPSGLSPVSAGSFSTGNPQEGYSAYHIDWNNGQMNGFLNGSGPNSMKYFTASQMAIEWDLAQQFSLGDMYFSSALTETIPNRLYEVAGYSPVINDYGPPPYIPYNQTVFSQLDSKGISWGYFINNTAQGIGPLALIHNMNTSGIGTWSNFYNDLANNTLPSVSWLMPINGGANQYSQHPSFNMLIGELWLLYTVNKIMHSPEWNSTAIFINYDEGGGYYDQVSPPVVASHQLGIRVPFIVISPYAKENYVSSTVLSHTSIIAFIDYNWNMPALNTLVLDSRIPLDFFNFNVPYANSQVLRGPLTFPSGITSLMPDSYNFGPSLYGDINNISSLFPMKFQIPLNEVLYAFTGSSNVTPGSLGFSVDINSNFSITPFYQSGYVVIAALIAGSAWVYYSYRKVVKK